MELRSSPKYVPPRDSNPCRLGECPNQLDYSEFWQHLPSESSPKLSLNLHVFFVNSTRPQTCSLSNTDSQQLNPAAGGTWCSGITSAPHAEGAGLNQSPVCPCLQLIASKALQQRWQGSRAQPPLPSFFFSRLDLPACPCPNEMSSSGVEPGLSRPQRESLTFLGFACRVLWPNG